MKILLVANTDWYLFRFRLGLAHFLTQQGHEVVFVSPPGEYTAEIQSRGHRWVAWQVGRQSANPFSELRSFLQLARIFWREQPNLIHLHTIKPVLYGSLAAGLLGRSAVVRSVTGLGYVFLGNDWRASVLRGVVTSAYRLLTLNPHGATIFENEHDRNFFIRSGLVRTAQSIVINGVGVDTDTYQPLPEPDGIPTVVLAARMLWDKGVGEFAEAARLLKNKLPARFVLVGDSDPGNPANIEASTLRAWVEEGVVEWWGWQSDMRAVFAAAHIVTLPSYGEGLPTVLIEAAACGRPLVATDVPGCRDVVQDGINGFLAPPKNAPALATAIERLLQDAALRQRMGIQSRRLAEEKFSAHVVNTNTYALYQRLMDELEVG